MTPTELEQAVSFIEARWGYQKVWSKCLDFFTDFEPYPAEGMSHILDDWFRKGNKFAPKPSELLKLLADRYPMSAERPAPADCTHPEPYGFDIVGVSRRAHCRLCLCEWDAPGIRTVLEVS